MMHNDGMSQLDLLVKRFSPPLLEVSRDSPEEPTLAPGDRVQAHVLANLPNGRFHVLIKDQVLDMNLPSNTQAGEKLDLSVVKTQPRLTFALTEDLQRALPQAAPNVKLSDAVKYLGALLSRAAPEGGKAAQSAAQASPLLAAGLADIDTGKLAESMQQQLSDSGVFFESHQAEWVTGQRSLQDLLREPQARLGYGGSQAPDNAVPQQGNAADNKVVDPHARIRPNSAAQQQTEVLAEKQGVTLSSAPSESLRPAAENASPRQLLPAEQAQLRDLVQQQLNLLDTRQLTWNGLAWPNQSMEWLVQERPGEQAGGDAEQPVWYSRLRLELPRLGEVIAAISLQNGAVKIHFQSDAATAVLLQNNQGKLERQLEAAGLKLLGTTVDRNESR